MKKSRKYIFALPAILMFIAIFISSHQSRPFTLDLGLNWNDKILHLIGYFVFGVSLLLATVGLRYEWSNKKIIFWVLLIGAIYGASDELHQYFIPGRSCDIFDWLTDCVALIISLSLIKIIRKLYLKLS